MKFNLKSIFILFILIFLLSGSFSTSSLSAPRINIAGSIDSVVGFNDYIKPGKYTRVQIQLTGEYAMRSGTVELSVPTNEEDYYRYRKYFVSNPSGTNVEFYVPTSCTNRRMSVTILDSKNNRIDSKPLSYNISYMESRLFVGVLTNQYEGLDYWNQLRFQSNELKGYSQALSSSQMPSDYLGLDMMDLIMMDQISPSQISALQWTALCQWVHNGGVLLIGSEVENIQDYLPDDLLSPEEIPLSLINESISSYLYGQGRIFLSDFPLTQLSGYFHESPDSEEELSTILFGEERLDIIYREPFGYESSLQDMAIRQTSQVQATQHLNIPLYIAVLSLYIGILLPTFYHILKKRDRLQYLRSAIAILAVTFAGIIFLLGSKTRFSHPFLNYISIEKYEKNQKQESVYMGIQAPYNRSYSISLDKSYQLIPLQQSKHWNTTGYQTSINNTVTVDYQINDNQVSFQNLVAFSTKNFYLERNSPLKSSQSFISNVNFYSDKVSGSLENHLGMDFNYAILVLPGHMTKIGKIPEGAQVILENCNSHLGRSSSYYQDIDFHSIAADIGLVSDPAATDKYLSLLSYYLQLCDANQETRGFLIGFTENLSDFQKETSYNANGLTLSVVPIDVNHTIGELTYSPVLPARTSTLMGDFTQSPQPILNSEFGIVKYSFPENYDLKQLDLYFDTETSKGAPYISEIYFFRTDMNAYVQVYPGQTSFSEKELKNFLSDHSLLVKYHANPDEGGGLPRLTTIGRIIHADNS